jgi:hypothetical protein
LEEKMNLSKLSNWRRNLMLPGEAKAVLRANRRGVPAVDPGIDATLLAMTDWLCRAQDMTASGDDGVSRDYSLIKGWNTSYPETTGYIIPTMIALARHYQRDELLERARKMLDWCRQIQLDDGGFQGGRIDARPVVPVTFNTGQILIGLAEGVRAFGDYHDAMHGAARFLRDSLDPDGCWRRHPTPFAEPGEKAYETHVAWGLFEAERVAPGEGYAEAAMSQVRWAITKQQPNGWVVDCCLNKPEMPLTHTLGYYLKGLVEAHRWSADAQILQAAELTARGLMKVQRPDGSLPGRLYSDWEPAVDWSCLTGNVQIADSWIYLAGVLGDGSLADAAKAANAYVRRIVLVEGPDGQRGGVPGSFPIDGDYGEFEYLNWAVKFAIDANLSEKALQSP